MIGRLGSKLVMFWGQAVFWGCRTKVAGGGEVSMSMAGLGESEDCIIYPGWGEW